MLAVKFAEYLAKHYFVWLTIFYNTGWDATQEDDIKIQVNLDWHIEI